ncbi:MAG: restriction endonuclease, partial [Acidimicrobiales bacterium]
MELRLIENGPPVICDLPAPAPAQLAGAGIVSMTPFAAGRWEVRAARKVGVVRSGPVTVWIRPKIAIARLLWLLGWARRPGWLGG